MKRCTKCDLDKEPKEFYKDRQKSDGLTPRCKLCFLELWNKQSKDVKFMEKKRASVRKSQSKRRLRSEVADQENEYRKMRYRHDEEFRKLTISRSTDHRSNKRKTDPHVIAIDDARRHLRAFFKQIGRAKTRGLGCDKTKFKSHIESQFKEGMSWQNYGDWKIDHIYSLSSAILEGEDRFKQACNYKNLQPSWAKDNLKKGNKVN